MTFITLEEAQARLPEIIDKQVPGEELYITKNDRIIAKLITEPKPAQEPRQLGTLKGTVLYMAPDFDAPLEEFKEHMP